MPRSFRSAAALLLLVLAPFAASAEVFFDVPATFSVEEGSDGTWRTIEVPLTLSAPAPTEVRFWVDEPSLPDDPGFATYGVDIEVGCNPCVLPAGSTSGALVFRVFGDEGSELDEIFGLNVSEVMGATMRTGSTVVTILDDDDTPPLLLPRPDHFVLQGGGEINVVANDAYAGELLHGGTISVETQPEHGYASILQLPGRNILEARVVYGADADYTGGHDHFTYRLCAPGGGQCASARVDVILRPTNDRTLAVSADGGFHDHVGAAENQEFGAVPIRFVGSRLATPRVHRVPLSADSTPETAWDGGGGEATLVSSLGAIDAGWRRIVVDVEGLDGEVDVYVGLDPLVDLPPAVDPALVKCTAAMNGPRDRCELGFAGSATGNLWIRVHNRSGVAQEAVVEVFDVPFDEEVGGSPAAVIETEDFSVTGPGMIPEFRYATPRTSWFDPTLLAGESRLGYVSLWSGEDYVGDFAVRIEREAGARQALAIAPGEDRALRLAPGETHNRTFIDVPHGATSLRVAYEASAPISLYLARGMSVAGPGIAPAPTRIAAVASGEGTIGELVVEGPTLQPGRWYLTPENETAGVVDVRLRPAITALAPVVRPGSYFNPDRGGHGVFLYPAGADTLTGLWYTYYQDTTPTWLYLQADAPGHDGIWNAGIYRAAWHGTSRTLARVGTATLTPTGADAFRWTYLLDGETGSEAMVSLGRGCPLSGGVALDASSTWFDPARAGTGYSTQFWGGDGYEYYAAFVYDAYGLPRFLTAEADTFGGESATLDLEYLRGFCPLCDRTGDPQRDVIGVLTRDIGAGTIESISVDAEMGVEFAWSVEDQVQPLGGAGSTQGCDP